MCVGSYGVVNKRETIDFLRARPRCDKHYRLFVCYFCFLPTFFSPFRFGWQFYLVWLAGTFETATNIHVCCVIVNGLHHVMCSGRDWTVLCRFLSSFYYELTSQCSQIKYFKPSHIVHVVFNILLFRSTPRLCKQLPYSTRTELIVHLLLHSLFYSPSSFMRMCFKGRSLFSKTGRFLRVIIMTWIYAPSSQPLAG